MGAVATSGLSIFDVLSDHWPLFRFHPGIGATLDSKPPTLPLEEYPYQKGRFRMLTHTRPEEAQHLLTLARHDVETRWRQYEQLANLNGATAHDHA
jgi:pyruvate-ferredoxin/flavodoxin oxidoreductase